jgi:hypothetical protein
MKKIKYLPMIKSLKKGKSLILFLVAAIIIYELYILFWHQSAPPKASQKKLETLAQEITTKCQKSSYSPTCYETEIPKLMDKPNNLSMEESFKVTALVQDIDTSYSYCHVLGHKLSAKEVQKDPTKWETVVTRCPVGVCSNGCIHGGFQERFREESASDDQIPAIKEELKTVCEKRGSWNPTGLEQASCYHALGHLAMYITKADAKKASSMCDEIAKKADGRDYSQLCYDGVFMQIFQPLEPEDFALIHGIAPTKDNVDNFCASFDGKRKASCISESWPLFHDQILQPQGIIPFCGREETSEQGRCINSMIYVLPTQLSFDENKMISYCNNLPTNYQPQCFSNTSTRFIETDYRNIDQSVNICNSAAAEEAKSRCFSELVSFSTYNFTPKSNEAYHLCNSLPGDYKDRCLKLQQGS